MKKLLLGFTSLTLICGTHLKASTTFDGAYVGIGIGSHSVDAKNTAVDHDNFQFMLDSKSQSASGRFDVGYNYFFNDFLVGVTGGYLISNNKKTITIGTELDDPTSTPFSDKVTVKASNAINLGLKFGYKVNEKALVYISPGLEIKKVKAVYSNQNDQAPDVSINKNLKGLNVKIGTEIIIQNNMSVFLSASHTFYKKQGAKNPATEDIDRGLSINHRPATNTFMIGAKYYFGNMS